MLRSLWLLCLLFPLIVSAQFRITGKVVDKADNKPIPGASVFLNNTSTGTATSPDGSFTLENIRSGQYDFVVSIMGYETYHQQVMVTADLALPIIAISVKANALKEIVIKPDAEWEKNYAVFKREFLGTSVYAQDCKILNPEVLDLNYEKTGRVLTASSQDFLIIENRALGYRIKYQVTDFKQDNKTGELYYAGVTLFENLPGKRSLERRWARNRLAVYKGSSMHFLRSAIGAATAEDGFKVLRLIRKPNPKYNGFGSQYEDALVSTPLSETAYIKPTDQKGLFALKFDDGLYVMFNGGKKINRDDPNASALNWSTTTVIFNSPYALFDTNGIFSDPSALSFDGVWGNSRVATLLPVDYEPAQK